ncbi:hypothetical protein HanRHA438_Chr12g0573361 [Helianthus annuus]|nr:hypothetical protein HanRHA438_Chr12g0573361 [Helianthus annuus]
MTVKLNKFSVLCKYNLEFTPNQEVVFMFWPFLVIEFLSLEMLKYEHVAHQIHIFEELHEWFWDKADQLLSLKK